jgi:hypothetical protein
MGFGGGGSLWELAQKVPGPFGLSPKEKIHRYLIAEYGFPPATLAAMSYRELKQYVEVARRKAKASRRGGVFGARVAPPDPAKAKAPRRQAVARHQKAEERDRWLYEQASKQDPPTWRALLGKLNKAAPEHRWKKLGSVQSVQQAVGRYIERNGLSPLPPRKAYAPPPADKDSTPPGVELS